MEKTYCAISLFLFLLFMYLCSASTYRNAIKEREKSVGNINDMKTWLGVRILLLSNNFFSLCSARIYIFLRYRWQGARWSSRVHRSPSLQRDDVRVPLRTPLMTPERESDRKSQIQNPSVWTQNKDEKIYVKERGNVSNRESNCFIDIWMKKLIHAEGNLPILSQKFNFQTSEAKIKMRKLA